MVKYTMFDHKYHVEANLEEANIDIERHFGFPDVVLRAGEIWINVDGDYVFIRRATGLERRLFGRRKRAREELSRLA